MKNITLWILPGIVALILLQTLWFKFTGQMESTMLFSMLHAEPWGRISAGVYELVAGILILVPKTRYYGAMLAAAAMVGALASHVLVLGFADGMASLALLAVIALLCSLTVAYTEYRRRGRRLF